MFDKEKKFPRKQQEKLIELMKRCLGNFPADINHVDEREENRLRGKVFNARECCGASHIRSYVEN